MLWEFIKFAAYKMIWDWTAVNPIVNDWGMGCCQSSDYARQAWNFFCDCHGNGVRDPRRPKPNRISSPNSAPTLLQHCSNNAPTVLLHFLLSCLGFCMILSNLYYIFFGRELFWAKQFGACAVLHMLSVAKGQNGAWVHVLYCTSNAFAWQAVEWEIVGVQSSSIFYW